MANLRKVVLYAALAVFIGNGAVTMLRHARYNQGNPKIVEIEKTKPQPEQVSSQPAATDRICTPAARKTKDEYKEMLASGQRRKMHQMMGDIDRQMGNPDFRSQVRSCIEGDARLYAVFQGFIASNIPHTEETIMQMVAEDVRVIRGTPDSKINRIRYHESLIQAAMALESHKQPAATEKSGKNSKGEDRAPNLGFIASLLAIAAAGVLILETITRRIRRDSGI